MNSVITNVKGHCVLLCVCVHACVCSAAGQSPKVIPPVSPPPHLSVRIVEIKQKKRSPLERRDISWMFCLTPGSVRNSGRKRDQFQRELT